MTNAPIGKEHFNLYYIFKEEKEKKTISKTEIDQLYKKMLFKLKNDNTS